MADRNKPRNALEELNVEKNPAVDVEALESLARTTEALQALGVRASKPGSTIGILSAPMRAPLSNPAASSAKVSQPSRIARLQGH
ncbi:MAG: hypothetical protein AAF957_12710 [Planctomycetota bacterium]